MPSPTRRILVLGPAALLAVPAIGLGRAAFAQAGRPLANTPATLAEVIAADRRLTRFAAMMGRAGLDQRLRQPGQWTVFAPTDAAFNALPGPLREALEGRPGGDGTADTSRANTVALQHVVPFAFPAERLSGRSTDVEALNGGKLTIDGAKNPIEVRAITTAGVLSAPGGNVSGAAKVVEGDIFVSNGVLHVIDQLLLP